MIVIKLFLDYSPDHLNFKTFSKKLTHYLGNENYGSKETKIEINLYIFFKFPLNDELSVTPILMINIGLFTSN